MSKTKYNTAIFFAVLAASLYAFSFPFSKIILDKVPPTMMAGLLYLGAGLGMSAVGLFRRATGKVNKEMKITRKEIPFTIGMVVLDIAAPIFLMIGLTMTTPENASLLSSFEIVATSLIAFFIFNEPINKKLWIGIIFITLASIILSVDGINSFYFSLGSVFVVFACVCWGFENNCTRTLSIKDPLEVVIIKGFGSGFGALLIAFFIHQISADTVYIIAALLLGFVSYGLSIYFYVYAQRELGAAKTSAYYSVSPFIGVLFSFIVFREKTEISFFFALSFMLIGTYLAFNDKEQRSV